MAAQLSFTGFAWQNLWRRRLRKLLTLGGVTMGIGAIVVLVGFSRGFVRGGWAALLLLAAQSQTASVVSTFVSPLHLLEALLIAIASGITAGAYPAWRGAHLSFAEALRYE